MLDLIPGIRDLPYAVRFLIMLGILSVGIFFVVPFFKENVLGSNRGMLPSGQSDSALTKKIIGTWSSVEKTAEGVVINEEFTLLPSGIANWSGTIQLGEDSRPIVASGTWKVKDGYLHYRIETSNMPEVMPNGFSSADKLVKVTDQELSYISSSDGKARTERRVR